MSIGKINFTDTANMDSLRFKPSELVAAVTKPTLTNLDGVNIGLKKDGTFYCWHVSWQESLPELSIKAAPRLLQGCQSQRANIGQCFKLPQSEIQAVGDVVPLAADCGQMTAALLLTTPDHGVQECEADFFRTLSARKDCGEVMKALVESAVSLAKSSAPAKKERYFHLLNYTLYLIDQCIQCPYGAAGITAVEVAFEKELEKLKREAGLQEFNFQAVVDEKSYGNPAACLEMCKGLQDKYLDEFLPKRISVCSDLCKRRAHRWPAEGMVELIINGGYLEVEEYTAAYERKVDVGNLLTFGLDHKLKTDQYAHLLDVQQGPAKEWKKKEKHYEVLPKKQLEDDAKLFEELPDFEASEELENEKVVVKVKEPAFLEEGEGNKSTNKKKKKKKKKRHAPQDQSLQPLPSNVSISAVVEEMAEETTEEQPKSLPAQLPTATKLRGFVRTYIEGAKLSREQEELLQNPEIIFVLNNATLDERSTPRFGQQLEAMYLLLTRGGCTKEEIKKMLVQGHFNDTNCPMLIASAKIRREAADPVKGATALEGESDYFLSVVAGMKGLLEERKEIKKPGQGKQHHPQPHIRRKRGRKA